MAEVLTLTIDEKIRIMGLAVETSNDEYIYVGLYKAMIDLIVNYEPEQVAIMKDRQDADNQREAIELAIFPNSQPGSGTPVEDPTKAG